ncbi:hypothetical protein [Pedobacter sp. SYSU D00535]|uniref:hypothetical protein n=1 Tax=Pedobacter sp. SYSU D00535 TaxID=2810308 RepID=UPI001A95BEA3|nr:hypothetical protein [Pedobacter sp. SYSU D00535]
MEAQKDLRSTKHYIVFRIGADTDIKNGRVKMVEKTLKALEAKEDYVACQALYDALQFHLTQQPKLVEMA